MPIASSELPLLFILAYDRHPHWNARRIKEIMSATSFFNCYLLVITRSNFELVPPRDYQVQVSLGASQSTWTEDAMMKSNVAMRCKEENCL